MAPRRTFTPEQDALIIAQSRGNGPSASALERVLRSSTAAIARRAAELGVTLLRDKTKHHSPRPRTNAPLEDKPIGGSSDPYRIGEYDPLLGRLHEYYGTRGK